MIGWGLCLVLLWVAVAQGQISGGGGSGEPPRGPLARAPVCTAATKGRLYIVTDGDSISDCTTGGGTAVNDCYCDGAGAYADSDNASGGGAPTDATYIVQTANGTLTQEQALAALATGIVLNTTTTGVLSIYAGAPCTNQFIRSLDAAGAATCADVTLGTDTAGDYVAGVTADQGLLKTGTEAATLGLIDCAATEVLQRNAGDTAWECAAYVPDTDDQTAAEVPFTPAGLFAATDVQAALEETDTDRRGILADAPACLVGTIGHIYTVTDALDGSNCEVGGNPGTVNICVCDGTEYTDAGGGAVPTYDQVTPAGSVSDNATSLANAIGDGGATLKGYRYQDGAGDWHFRVCDNDRLNCVTRGVKMETGSDFEIENAAGTLTPLIITETTGAIDMSAAPTVELPNAASCTLTAFGQVCADNNLWGTGRGTVLTYDGTATTALLNIPVTDVPVTGDVPHFNATTDTWEAVPPTVLMSRAFGCADNDTTDDTNYLLVSQDSTITCPATETGISRAIVEKTGVLTYLACSVFVAPGATETFVFIVREGPAGGTIASDLTCTIANTETSCTATNGTNVITAASDLMSIEVTASAGSADSGATRCAIGITTTLP